MAEIYQRTFSGSPTDLVARARQAAARFSSEFQGDERAGTFSGYGVEGTYAIEGQQVTLTVFKKPFFATSQMVESGLDRFFA